MCVCIICWNYFIQHVNSLHCTCCDYDICLLIKLVAVMHSCQAKPPLTLGGQMYISAYGLIVRKLHYFLSDRSHKTHSKIDCDEAKRMAQNKMV